MEKSDSIENLAKGLSVAQSKFSQIKRTEKVDFTGPGGRRKYNYAPLEEIIAACRNALSENGLAVLQLTSQETAEYITLETVLTHSSGEWISGTMRVPAYPAEPQRQGSALTYARRYALSALLNVASEEDDDGNEASGKAPQKEVAKPPVNSPTPVQTAKPAVAPPSASGEVVNVGVDMEWLREQFLKMPSPWSAGTCMSWMEYQFKIKRGKTLEDTIALLTPEQKNALVKHVAISAGAK